MRASARRKTLCALLSVTATLTAALAGAPIAQGEGVWWSLGSSSRPSFLKSGAGKPGIPGEAEVQKITVPLEEFEGFGPTGGFTLNVGGKSLESFLTEPAAAEIGLAALTAASVQTTLEALYGKGKVQVSEETLGETLTLHVSSPSGVEPIGVESVGLPATPSVEILTPGTPEVPATPDGEIVLTAENLGDQSVSGHKSPLTLSDVLPPGLEAIAIEGSKPSREGNFLVREALPCSLETLSCTMGKEAATPSFDALAPYDQIEMRIAVNVHSGASSGEMNEVKLSGGESFTCKAAPGSGSYRDSGCTSELEGGGFERSATGLSPAQSLRRPLAVSSDPVPFGVEGYLLANEEEGGEPTRQAGAHPFQQTTSITLNQTADTSPPGSGVGEPHVNPVGMPKDVHFRWPAGLIGNPTPIAQCTDVQFFTGLSPTNLCPPQSAVGVATVTVNEPSDGGVSEITVPLFNLVPRVGEPARLGFNVIEANAPVTIDTSVRTGGDYGVTVSVNNITQTAAFLSSKVTVWGVPGDPRHDRQRGWGCLLESRGFSLEGKDWIAPCGTSTEQNPPPFLSLPTSCDGPLKSTVETDPWSAPGAFRPFTGEFSPEEKLIGCNRLPFSAEIRAAPDVQQASTPSGLTVDVHVPQEEDLNSAGISSSNVKDINVVLPEGVTLNPAAADGLEACSEDQIGYLPQESIPPGELHFSEKLPEPLLQGQNFCPDAAKVATAKITSPLLPKGDSLEGAVYLANPAPNGEAGQNPFNTLVAMYILAKDPVSGALVKLPGRVGLNQATGRIESSFENNPQLAFEDAELHFFGGARAPLSTPAHCGTYTTEATFTPWSGTPPVKSSSSFQITQGPNGGPCPPSALPFSPTLATGSPNINAGSFSALSTTISREDGNQDINNVQLHFAPGMSGILAGIPLCPEALANTGTCPEASKIGETIVSVGLGQSPFTVTAGKVYLTEKYQGAPFGLSIVNPADAGPFHLGKVIVRAKIEIDPLTTALTVTTGQIPHILDGVPLQIKHVNVNINRAGFTFNPTNCNPQSISGTIGSVQGASAQVSTPFQVTNCANLKFAPDFKVSTAGKTSKANGASLKVKLTYPKAPFGTYANLAKVKVSLPKQLPSRLTTLQKACTAAVFAANPAGCPKESIVGQAKVNTPLLPVPLTGPAYFVSHGGEAFPDLTIVLQGYGVTAELIGSTSIKNGVTTTTLKATPDVPFSSFELNLPQGKFSALAANANLCKSKLTMPTEFTAQNGSTIKQATPISVSGCKKKAETHAQKLAKAMKACKKKHDRGKRAACEAQARKRFGAVKKGKKGSAKSGSKKR